MTFYVILFLIALGFLLIVLEIFVMPGTAIIGIAGLILMIAGIWSTYDTYGTTWGNYTLLATGLSSFVLIVYALKSNTWKAFMLKAELQGKSISEEDHHVEVGQFGVTSSRLAPMGKALINNQYYEVHSSGIFIDQNVEIVVVKTEGLSTFVEVKNK
ncbi:MAG: hypothetical protein COB85_07660 [Bacteroidetes bacterium]|nr:MAG: hypothetical protein COB85_07660 [Bacteroidota bacterium]